MRLTAAAACVVTMLPNSRIVRDVLLGAANVAQALPAGTIVIDMSSSVPTDTVALAADLAAYNIALIDAPVSGGVKRAVDGSLAIMAGGATADLARVRPVLEAMGEVDLPHRRDQAWALR